MHNHDLILHGPSGIMICGKCGRAESKAGPVEYSEGICGDGAAILKDGVPMTISEIIAALNGRSRR